MGTLKEQLTSDLRDAMKARDQTTTGTLRMLLAAVRNAEVAEQAVRELTDPEILTVLTREGRKRREAAEAYEQADRAELAAQERAELVVVERYLPSPLTDQELTELVAGALAGGEFSGPKAMGQAMKAAQAAVAGRAEGARVATEVRRQLAG